MLVVGIVVIAAVALTIRTGNAGDSGPLKPGSAAPAFAATTLPDSGAAAAIKGIADYRGRPVLLNIWATWCNPCREEMPRIQRLHTELGPSGLAIVAVSIDNPGMAGAIRSFRDEMGLSFEILYDESGKIRDQYQTAGVPETFIIDRDGVIRRRMIGASWTENDVRPLLQSLVADSAR